MKVALSLQDSLHLIWPFHWCEDWACIATNWHTSSIHHRCTNKKQMEKANGNHDCIATTSPKFTAQWKNQWMLFAKKGIERSECSNGCKLDCDLNWLDICINCWNHPKKCVKLASSSLTDKRTTVPKDATNPTAAKTNWFFHLLCNSQFCWWLPEDERSLISWESPLLTNKNSVKQTASNTTGWSHIIFIHLLHNLPHQHHFFLKSCLRIFWFSLNNWQPLWWRKCVPDTGKHHMSPNQWFLS